MEPYIIDAFEFGRAGERREGQLNVVDLARLAAACADSSGVLSWSLQAGTDVFGHLQLSLAVAVTVNLICQRCLEPFPIEVKSASSLILAKSDEQANEIEDKLEDDAVDVIVGSNTLDLLALIEDEVLLALPLSARHEVCTDASALEKLKSEKLSPFAVLKDLKH